jgi:nucleoid-associated protein YgaU
MKVSLESYSIEEKAGEEGDIYVGLELKEYKEYLTQEVAMLDIKDGKAIVTIKEQRPSKIPAKSYTVKAGDTLWTIAKRELNDETKVKEIAKLNNISNPNKINVGQVLRLS